MNINQKYGWWLLVVLSLMGSLLLAGCGQTTAPEETAVTQIQADDHADDHDYDAEADMLLLPALEAVELAGAPLKVIATTSMIGDVAAQVGGEAIDLTTLMSAGQDPHSYQPGARELTAVANADVILVNGWDLEEALVHDLEQIGGNTPLIALSANIAPLTLGADEHDEEDEAHEEEGDDHGHSGADPHVWFSIENVVQWTRNVAQILSDLDPANAETYASNAAAYQAELAELAAYAEAQLSQIPEERRFLVTNHDAFGYLARDYGFTVLGTVIPGMSTLAEPSARDLAGLIEVMQEHGVCSIFTETTVSDALAQTVVGELSHCDEVRVVKLYTGAVGPAGSGADSYIGMFRTNVDAIVAGQQ
ncbi:MAG: zinc ABC transporter substrate-binding protein [Chloroflexota bacterium]